MRLTKTINIDKTRTATVNELRVKDARNIILQAKTLHDVPTNELLTERFGDLVNLLGDCVELPDGTGLDDLTFSEIQKIKEALLEVNAAFLDLTGMADLLRTLSASSTGPAAPSSSEDTPA